MKKRFYPYQVSAVIGGVEILAMVRRVPRAGKQDGPAARFIDEMPLEERPKGPPASEILPLYARAERAVRSRV